MCRYFFKYFNFSQIHTKTTEINNEHKKLLFTDYRLLITDYQSFNRLIGSSLTFPSPENGRWKVFPSLNQPITQSVHKFTQNQLKRTMNTNSYWSLTTDYCSLITNHSIASSALP